LLSIAEQPAEKQVEAVKTVAARKSVGRKKTIRSRGSNASPIFDEPRIETDLRRLGVAWEAACTEARVFFLTDDSVCDVLAELGCDPRSPDRHIGARVRAIIEACEVDEHRHPGATRLKKILSMICNAEAKAAVPEDDGLASFEYLIFEEVYRKKKILCMAPRAVAGPTSR
jgi:hypothetical protein